MRHLGQAGERFYEPIQIIGGAKTRARVQRSKDGDQPGAEFALPKTTLRVDPRSIIRNRMVIQVRSGDKFLVGEHSATTEYTTHHLFPVDRQVSWTRPTTRIDPVSKVKVTSTPEQKGMIWVMWERTRREFMDLSIRIAQENYLVATGADVQIGDYIDGKIVRRVALALGIKVLELQA